MPSIGERTSWSATASRFPAMATSRASGCETRLVYAIDAEPHLRVPTAPAHDRGGLGRMPTPPIAFSF
jgi:hypothetical protein